MRGVALDARSVQIQAADLSTAVGPSSSARHCEQRCGSRVISQYVLALEQSNAEIVTGARVADLAGIAELS